MTDQFDLEGGQTGGTASTPTNAASQSDAQQLSVNAETLKSLVDTVKELQGHVRSLQSGKDRGNYQTQQEVSSLKNQIAWIGEMLKAGYQPEQVEREMLLNDVLAEYQQRRTQPQASGREQVGSPPPVQTGADAEQVRSIINALDLDENDPQVVELLRRGNAQQGDFVKLKLDRKAKVQAGSPSSIPPTSVGTANTGEDVEILSKRLEALQGDKSIKSRKEREEATAKLQALLKKQQ